MTDDARASAKAERLAAFAHLYGYIRFFHPSDEAAHAEWDELALVGLRSVLEDDGELREVLREWLAPIAPAVRVIPASAPTPPLPAEFVTGADLPQVAWQHLGLEIGDAYWPYKSGRTNRTRVRDERDFAKLRVSIDLELSDDAKIVFETDALSSEPGRLELDLYATAGDETLTSARSTFEMSSDERTTRSISIDVPAAAEKLGAKIELLDAVNLDLFDADIRIAGSEERYLERLRDYAGKFFDRGEGAWLSDTNAYEFELGTDEDDPFVRWKPWSDPPFFEDRPAPLETLRRPIGCGLDVVFPVSLGSRDGHTVPVAAAEPASAVDEPTTLERQLASLVIAWNVLQHSFPYFDNLDVDWRDVLTDTLRKVVSASNRDEVERALDQMLVPLKDGHAAFYRFDQPIGLLPVYFDWIDSELVVLATAEGIDLPIGARVLSLGDVDAETAFRAAYDRISGSDRYRRMRACEQLTRGPWSETVTLRWEAGGVVSTTDVTHDQSDFPPRFQRNVVEELEPGVWYVDGIEIDLETLDSRAEELASARVIIVDFRGYPSRHATELLGHFIDRPIECGLWNVPQIIYPDHEPPVGYSDDGRWDVAPRAPHLGARAYFLTNANAISYGETIMEMVEHYELGTIVGEATAGTNGNVNFATLPDGSRFIYTGMLVLKQDGSPLNQVGVRPHHPVRPTREGLAAGRDEVLETALRLTSRVEFAPNVDSLAFRRTRE